MFSCSVNAQVTFVCREYKTEDNQILNFVNIDL